MTPKQTSFAYALAKIQQLQDMYSKYFQVSITIYNVDNQPVTIPSNQIPFCNSKLTETDSVCQVFSKRLTQRPPEALTVTTCPYQCFYAIAPLGLPLDISDTDNANFYIIITQPQHQNTEALFTSFHDIVSFSSDPETTDFYELSNLIVSGFDIIFSLMSSNDLALTFHKKDKIKINKEALSELTSREQEIIHLVSIGMSNQQIAGHLQISEHTVKAHISNILKKLSLSNRTQLAVYEMLN